ncbi:MAG: fimbrial protein [Scandinavium sp.]|uniref:fimbrial protein n=1 Tax=Scandinavium sp. TaxID=2830653 RepID=UPI003F36D387
MNLKALLLVAISGCLSLSATAHAAGGTINVAGHILDNTCVVAVDSENITVKLGDVASKDLSEAGKTSLPQAFTINLEKCGGSASNVSVSFEGTPDANNTDLLAIAAGAGNASGIGIALYDQSNSLIPINTVGESTKLIPDQATVALLFYANFMANGQPVIAGTATASATFTLHYA